MKQLSPQQLSFVGGYALGKSAAEAARLAGYRPQYAKRAADKLLNNPAVKAAVDEVRARIRDETMVTAERLMGKLEDALGRAIDAKQFTAVARILELQGKLSGVLIERMHHLHEQIDVAGALADARGRVEQHRKQLQHVAVIDVEAEPAPARNANDEAPDPFAD